LAALVVAALLPWKSWVETKLKSEIAARGITGLEFTLDTIGFKGLTLKNLSLNGFALESLTLGYAPLELLRGNVKSLNAGDITVKQGDMEIKLGAIEAELPEGRWKIHDIHVTGTPLPLPPLEGEGTLSRQGDIIRIDGTFKNADAKYKAVFAANIAPSEKEKTAIILSSVALPWNGGTLSTRNVSIPLYSEKTIVLKLQLQNVSMDALLQQATGNRATATGTVSGGVPVTIRRDGSFTLQTGTLKAQSGGTITLDPSVIPGDNQQVALVRELLKNFNYKTLSLGVESGKDEQLSMLLSLQGNNPEVYNGRMINLNVHLTGDLLDLVQQSLLSMDTQKLLEKDSHAKD